MAKKPWNHPPRIAGPIHRPTNDTPGYIYGHGGVAGFGARDFHVAQVPSRLARQVIIEHHYSGRVVQNSYVHLGVFREGVMEGVLQFGYSMNPAHADKVVAGATSKTHLELNRMWLADAAPRNSESRALSHAMKYLRQAMPHVEWVQSFADERCGCLGVVYQAANFLYLGSHRTAFYELDGQIYHPMLMTAHGKNGRRGPYLLANRHRATRHSLRQFRYIFFLRKAARRRLKMRVRPYPKPADA